VAYVGYNKTTDKKPIEKQESSDSSVIQTVGETTKAGFKAAKFLNDRNERLLTESGYLDLSIPSLPGTEDPYTDTPDFKMFVRKAGRGPLRKPTDRIQFSDKAKQYFVKLAELENFKDGVPTGKTVLPQELMNDYIDSLEGENEGLKQLPKDLGLDEAIMKRDEFTAPKKIFGEEQVKLQNEARERAKEFVKNIQQFGFEGKKGGLGFKETKGVKEIEDKYKLFPNQIPKSGVFNNIKPDLLDKTKKDIYHPSANYDYNNEPMISKRMSPFHDYNLNKLSSLNKNLDSSYKTQTNIKDKFRSNLSDIGIEKTDPGGLPDFKPFNPLEESTKKAQGLLDSVNFRDRFGGENLKPTLNKLSSSLVDPAGAVKNKIKDQALSSVGIKPGLMDAMGPAGWLAKMALGNILKPHTVAGKLFKIFG